VPVFNREMLALARESRGLTQAAFAADIGISQAEISKFENGIKTPDDAQIRKIAGRLEYDLDFFFLDESIRAFGSGCVYHRKRKSATDAKLAHLLATVNVKRIQVKQLMKSVESRNGQAFARLDVDEYKGGPEEVARALRALWQLPPGPIQNLLRVIEDAGGIVIKCDFGTNKVDALSQWLPGYPPIFLVNAAIPTDRMRFTLSHEVGHITMHRTPTDNMEREADRFAAEFLMPERDIRPHLGYVDIPRLAAMKPYWRVAMSALLYRASELGTIDDRRKSYLWFLMGKSGYRTHEPVEIPPEDPTLLRELIDFHRRSLNYGEKELDKVLLEPGAFAGLRNRSTPTNLRIVGK
jgi:Zn-dependent peptidase ImmA (M78 family)/transcriptional regulator with XRE-family HTH domain